MSIGKKSRANVARVRDEIFARDGFVCVASVWGSHCRGQLTIQHAVKRGMGGSQLFDTPKFLRTMCFRHNDLDASDATFRRMSLINGWSMMRQEATMLETPVPVLYSDGSWYVLDDAFNRELVSDTQAAIWRSYRLDFMK